VSALREPLPTRVTDTVDLPPAYHDAVGDGLEALGIDLSESARAAIDGHIRLLLAWTWAVNLTAIRDPGGAGLLHVVDSLAAVPLLRAWSSDRFLDLGSGGGLPGIPLAAAIPAARCLLVEPIGKKARFLEAARAAIGLERVIDVANARAETLARDPRHRGAWPVVTARAVAPTADLVELAFPLLADGGRLVAWKRGDLDAELRGARHAVAAMGGGTLDVIDVPVASLPSHRLVVVTRGGRVPDEYPRDPAARRRRPW
jgi:16S rRNA (guanine527-N7)-methyltransferase